MFHVNLKWVYQTAECFFPVPKVLDIEDYGVPQDHWPGGVEFERLGKCMNFTGVKFMPYDAIGGGVFFIFECSFSTPCLVKYSDGDS